MQSFNIIGEDQTIYESLAILNNNFRTLASNFSGTVAPQPDTNTPIVPGTLWYNTAENRVYQLDYNTPGNWVLSADLNGTATTKEYVDGQISGHNHDATYLKRDEPAIDTQNVNGRPANTVIYQSNISDTSGTSDQYIAPSSRLFEKLRQEVRTFIDALGDPDTVLEQLKELLQLIEDNQGALDNLKIDNIQNLREELDARMLATTTLEDLGGVRADGGTTTGFNGRILFKSTSAIANGGAVIVGRDGTNSTLQAVRIWDDGGVNPDAVQLGDVGARTFINAQSPNDAFIAVGGTTRHRIWSEGNIADLDTVLAARDFMKEADADLKYLRTTGKAADSFLLNGVAEDTEATADTIVKRDASGDVKARYFRSGAPAGISSDANFFVVQREANTGGDNSLRPISSARAKAALGLSNVPNWSEAELDARYINASGDEVTGDLYVSGNFFANNFGVWTLPEMQMGNGGVTDEYLVLSRRYTGTALNATGVSGHFKFNRGSITESHTNSDVFVVLSIDNDFDNLGLFDQYGTAIFDSIDAITIDGVGYYAAKIRSTGGGDNATYWQFEGAVINTINDSNILSRVRASDTNVTFVSSRWVPGRPINTFNLVSQASSSFLRLDGSNVMTGDINMGANNIVLNGAAGIDSNASSTILRDHSNGNVTISATSNTGDLYIGYNSGTQYQTQAVRLESDLYTNSKSLKTIDAQTGQVFDGGTRVYSPSNNSAIAVLNRANTFSATNTFSGLTNHGSISITNAGNVAAPLVLTRSSQVGIQFNITSLGNRYFGVDASGSLRYGSNLDHSSNATVWHSSNDGTGSGLDADLLDGQEGGYYGIREFSMLRGTTARTNPDSKLSSAYRYDPSPDNPTNHHYAGLTYGNEGNVTGQFFTHFTSGESYVRAYNTDWSDWRKLWDNKNMGSGSGLDADTVDGIQGSSMLRSDANDTATGVVTFTAQAKTSKAQTSGVSFASAPVKLTNSSTINANGRTSIALASSTVENYGISLNAWRFSTSGQSRFEIRNHNNSATGTQLATFGTDGATILGQKAWTAGNDGPGSGLNADLLDGLHASSFSQTSHNHDGRYTRTWNLGSSGNSSGWRRVGEFTGSASDRMQVRVSGRNGYGSITPGDATAEESAVFNWTWGNGASGTMDAIVSCFVTAFAATPTVLIAAKLVQTADFVVELWVQHGTYHDLRVECDGTEANLSELGGPVSQPEPTGTNQHDLVINRYWHSANDGNGSGLDADLLDGLQSSQFLRSDASDTMNGNLTMGTNAIYGSSTSYAVDFNATDVTMTSVGDIFINADSNDNETGRSVRMRAGQNTLQINGGAGSQTDSILYNGGKVWHAGNDGSGSGLDADLLDGAQRSLFTENASAETVTGNWTFNGNTSFLADSAGGFRLRRNTSSATGDDVVDFVVDDGGLTITVDNDADADSSKFQIGRMTAGGFSETLYVDHNNFRANGATVWTASTDGAGSGLDADLLDGLQGSSYMRSNVPYIGLDSVGSASYPRMVPVNNPGTSSLWIRANSSSGGFLPYVNGGSQLGTSSWRWSQIHGNTIYQGANQVLDAGDAGDGISIASNLINVDSSVVRTSRTLTAGNGLSGGGSLASNRTFSVNTDRGLSIVSDQVGISLGTDSGLNTSGGTLKVDISGTSETMASSGTDVLLMQTSTGLKRITRDNLLSGASGGVEIRGSVNPTSSMPAPITELDVDGDPENATISQGVAPVTASPSSNGFTYIILLDEGDRNTGVTIQMSGTSADPEDVTVFDQDQLIWVGDRFIHLETGDSVASVFGRYGAVTALAGDYNAAQITNSPSGQISATNVQAAINELESEKGGKAVANTWTQTNQFPRINLGSSSYYINQQNTSFHFQTPSGYIEIGPKNTSWCHIYSDRNFYFNRELYRSNNKVWDAGNDGSGSGLDADLLDGIQGASFLRSDANDTATGLITINRTGEMLRLGGSTPLDGVDGWVSLGNASYNWQMKYVGSTSGAGGNEFRIESAGTSGTGVYWQFDHSGNFQYYDGTNTRTMWHSGNDGSGSGLDADLLDGLQGSAYGKLAADNIWAGQNTFSDDASFGNNINMASGNAIEWSGVSVSNSGSSLTVNGNAVWTTGNDGSGSGLDADTVDGIQGANILRNNVASQTITAASPLLRMAASTGTDSFLDVRGAANRNARIAFTEGGTHGGDIYYDGSANYVRFRTIASGTPTEVFNVAYNSNVLRFANTPTVAGAQIWHQNNDGPGSGLNADTVDGIQAASFLRSDANDTATGNLTLQGNVLQASNRGLATGRFHPTVGGGHFETTTPTLTGYIKITLPVSWTNTMMSFWVDVYEYTSNHTFSVLVGGYNYSSGGWTNTSATIVGPSGNNYAVRFGHDGSNCCVWIGEATTSWSYTQVRVRDFHHGYSDTNVARWNDGWSVDIDDTAIPNLDQTHSNCYTYAQNANQLDGLNSTQFLRSDASDSFSSGVLSITSSSAYALSLSGSNDAKMVLQGTSNPYIRFRESSTDKAYIQWTSSGYLQIVNQEQGTVFRVNNEPQFSPNNGTNVYRMWHQGNDGSGSGLDADLLDGQQGSAYARTNIATETFDGGTNTTINVVSNNDGMSTLNLYGAGQGTGRVFVGQDISYGGGIIYDGDGTPDVIGTADRVTFFRRTGGNDSVVFDYAHNSSVVDFKSTPTASGQRIWHAGNDGPGSGLNADTVDGVQASDIGQLPEDNYWQGTNTFAVPATFESGINLDSNNLVMSPTVTLGTTGSDLSVNGARVWDSSNDGSGSGLDADTVDGKHVNSSGSNSWSNIIDKIPFVDNLGFMEIGNRLDFHSSNDGADYTIRLEANNGYLSVIGGELREGSAPFAKISSNNNIGWFRVDRTSSGESPVVYFNQVGTGTLAEFNQNGATKVRIGNQGELSSVSQISSDTQVLAPTIKVDSAINTYMDQTGVYDDGERVFSANNPPPTAAIEDQLSYKFDRLFLEGGFAQYFALGKDERLYSFGESREYNMGLGRGSVTAQRGFKLVQLPYTTHTVQDVHMQGDTVYAQLRNRTTGQIDLWGWGRGGYGNFGDAAVRYLPTELVTDIAEIYPCRSGTYANGGMLYYRQNGTGKNYMCLGRNSYGRCGDGTTTATTSGARQMALPNGISISRVTDIYNMGRDYGCTFLRTNTDRLYACGFNSYGQLGIGNNANQSTWQEITSIPASDIALIEDVQGGYGYHNASGEISYGFTIIRCSNGRVYSTGSNYNNQNGTGATRNTFARIYSSESYTRLITMGSIGTAALQTTDGLKVWGYDELAVWTGRIQTQVNANTITNAEIMKGQSTMPNISMYLTGWYRAYKRMYVFWWDDGRYYIPSNNVYGMGGGGNHGNKETFDDVPIRQVPIRQDETVIQMGVATNYDHPATYCLTNMGNLYHCGHGGYNQQASLMEGQHTAINSTWTKLN